MKHSVLQEKAITLAVLLSGLVLIPVNVHAQQRASFEGRAGVAVPTGRLAKLADAGPNMGLQLGYPVGERLAVNLEGDIDLLQGGRLTAGRAPNMKLWRYGAGIEARILQPRASRWSLTADVGLGATTFDTDDFLVPNTTSRQDFTETYFTSGAGMRLGYQVSPRMSTHIGAGANWMSADAQDTRILHELDPVRVKQFSSAWSVPVTFGINIRTGGPRMAQEDAPARARTAESRPNTPRTVDSSRDREREAAMAILQERVHFDFDRYEIKPEFARLLERKAEVLRRYPELQILIEGHCDEWGSVEYNQALGHRRATAVRSYLSSRGVTDSRMRTTSFGKERPLSTESSEFAWAQNRRAEFLVENERAVSMRIR